jgi:PAS domain S-box-containing protein
MERSIGKRLFRNGLIALLLIMLLIIASLIVVGLYKKTSGEVVIEYHEMNSIQEFNLSVARLLISIDKYPLHPENFDVITFDHLLLKSGEKLAVCKRVLTTSHNLSLLNRFENVLYQIDTLSKQMFRLQLPEEETEVKKLLGLIQIEISSVIKEAEFLVDETKREISEYENIYNTVLKHGTLTILTLGVLIIFILLAGGWRIIRNISTPIKELVITTNKISEGDRTAKVTMNTKDEFHTLAQSFNKMVDSLNQTTVSKDYLDNILKNMYNALTVTDNMLFIRSVNQATLNLLGYSENDLVGKNISILFGKEDKNENGQSYSESELIKQKAGIEERKTLRSKSGKKIAAIISCTLLRNKNEGIDGLIVIGHDLTERKTMEEKLEQIRKERLIEINEAQEEEKIRIAKDLHDGLGQMLTAISYSVQELLPEGFQNEKENRELISKTQQQIDAAIQEAKNLAHNLIPIVLKDFGLIPAIENLIQRANDMHKTHFSFNAFDFDERIDARLEKTFYRICQESLNNIVKHAQAKNAIFQIYRQYRMIVLVIEDDGAGFDINTNQKKRNSGIGLISIRERVLAFNGSFTINSEAGNGTELIIEIPCPKKKHHEKN